MVKSRTVTCVTLQPQKNYLPVTAFSHRFHIRPVQYNHPAGMRQVPPAGQGAGKSPVMRGGIRPNCIAQGQGDFGPSDSFLFDSPPILNLLFIINRPRRPLPKRNGAAGVFWAVQGAFPFSPFICMSLPLPCRQKDRPLSGSRPDCRKTKFGGNVRIGAGVKITKKRAQNKKFYSIFFKKSRASKGQSPLAGAHFPYFRS